MTAPALPSSAVLTFARLTAPEADLALVKQALFTNENRDANRPFIQGDHWQEGAAWVGPAPAVGDATRSDILTLIERSFIFRNVLTEIIDRIVSACLGKEQRWAWVPRRVMQPDEEPTTAEQTTISELTSATTEWWDERYVHAALKSQLWDMLWGTTSCWRLIAPSPDGIIPQKGSLRDALMAIFVDRPTPENATVWEDPQTRQRVGITLFVDAQGKEHAEVVFVEPRTQQTVIRILPPDGITRPEGTNNFGGALTMFQVALEKPYVTGALRSLQKVLNMTLTLLGKGLVDSTFLERLILNALPPGHWEYQTEADGVTIMKDENGQPIRKAFVPAKHVAGGRITNYVQGIDFMDKDGKVQITQPSVVFRPPGDHSGTIAGADFWYASMLGEARQDFVLIAKDATVSGKSREQARGDFIDASKDPQKQAELSTHAILFAAVAMAEKFMNQPGKYTKDFKPVVQCRMSYGPLSVDERTQNIAEAKDGYRSDDSAMELNGVDDVVAERQTIAAQPRSQLRLSTDQATAVDDWVTAGFARFTALRLIGLDEEQVKEIIKWEEDAVTTDTSITPATPPVAAGGASPNAGGTTPASTTPPEPAAPTEPPAP